MRPSLLGCVVLFVSLAGTAAGQTVVLATDFSSVPAAVAPGSAALEGVQGFAGLGPAGSQFGGTFLRSATGNPVTISLTNLPPHDAISIDFLFAAIDSLDGTGAFPSGDFFAITIDGNTFFRESFANATTSQIQSYVPPPGVELARFQDLGFSGPGGFYTDSAYWLGGDPTFQAIGHSASTLTITMVIEGPGIQPLSDESWAIDNLTISTFSSASVGSATAYGTSCGPSLSVFGTPTTSQPLSLFVGDLPGNTVLTGYMIGLSDQSVNGMPLPLSLDPYGALGCVLLQDAAITLVMPLLLQGTAGTAALPVPGAMAGLTFFLQAWGLAAGVNPADRVFSNGVRIVLGS
ncbi:MAG: hypothetical protein JNK78_05365 [Planctomycetes bacterium]|nr:hypothetical protein [Planctomycetota bacterium]